MRSLATIFLTAALTLSATLLHPYLFLDETWYVRPWHYAGWGSLGRPLLDYVMLATEYCYLAFGLDSIYLYRIVGILLLFFIGAATFAWLVRFRFRPFDAAVFAAGLISLPAFQVLSATSVQLGAAIVAAFVAAFAIRPLLEKQLSAPEMAIRIAVSVAAGFAALCIYQASLLLLFALLLLPMLQIEKWEIRKMVALVVAYGGIAVVVGIYYGAWIVLYKTAPGGMNAKYSPHAVSAFAILGAFKPFIITRFVQTANLWYVESLKPSPLFLVSVLVVCAGFASLIYSEGYHGLLKAMIAAGTLPVCDIFRLATVKSPTYTTLHPLAAAWWLLFAWSLIRIAGVKSRLISVPAVAAGIGVASFVTTPYIALHNAPQLAAIENALRAAPDTTHIHIIGVVRNFKQPYEYGWTSGGIGNYLRAMVCDVAGPSCGHILVTTSHLAFPDPPAAPVHTATVIVRLQPPP